MFTTSADRIQWRPGSPVRSNFGFKHRGLVGALLLGPLALAILFSAPRVAEGEPLSLVLNASAWVFFLMHASIRIWATLFVGGNKDRRLQTDGPYSLCRNPLYLGSLCFAVSIACVLKSPWFVLGVAGAAAYYLKFVIPAEEHFLGLRFGELFRDYCLKTPRFWPSWSRLHSPTHVHVDLKRLKQESVRLGRSALMLIFLELLMSLRSNPGWPHWFHLP